MEFVQWRVQSIGEDRIPIEDSIVHNGLFILDNYDKEICNKEIIAEAISETEEGKEIGMIDQDSDKLYLHVEGEDESDFRKKAIDIFSRLLDANMPSNEFNLIKIR
jgi:hypothetical protein